MILSSSAVSVENRKSLDIVEKETVKDDDSYVVPMRFTAKTWLCQTTESRH